MARVTKVRVPSAPGTPRSWLDLLPTPYREDPTVVVVMLPTDAVVVGATGADHQVHMNLMKRREQLIGLQIVDPPLTSWTEQSDLFMRFNIQIASPAHVGRLSMMPQQLFIAEGSSPLLFLRDAMEAPYLNLRQHIRALTKQPGREAS